MTSDREEISGLPRTPRVPIALAIVVRGGDVLVARRDASDHAGGVWEFPGGKVEGGESPGDAARRELREELSIDAVAIEPLVTAVYDYPDRTLRFHAFLVREFEGSPHADGGRPTRWVAVDALADLEMPPANGPIVRAIRWRVAGEPTPGPRDTPLGPRRP